ncbi:hypothetical protein [Gynuella sp.]|uniref:hypothetical protein n=1 Tax=Gynuella sp. TaxID=2969146 RepID=UPI003D11869F
MLNFLLGVISSLVATLIYIVTVKWIVPSFINKFLYDGITISGSWDVYELQDYKKVKSGRLELEQKGRIVTGTSIRKVTRDGKESNRKFIYHGSISGHQLTLMFEDANGKGFDTGSYIFIVENNLKKMVGRNTFHGKRENEIVSEKRFLVKAL